MLRGMLYVNIISYPLTSSSGKTSREEHCGQQTSQMVWQIYIYIFFKERNKSDQRKLMANSRGNQSVYPDPGILKAYR